MPPDALNAGAILDGIADAIIATDTSGRITFLNAAAETLTGWPLAEARGCRVEEVASVMDGDSAAGNVVTLRTREGDMIPVECSIAAVRDADGKPAGSVRTIRRRTAPPNAVGYPAPFSNLNERRRAEQALMESEQRYRTFLNLSTEGVWRYENDPPIPIDLPEDEQVRLFFERGWLAECNDALARMFGYRRAHDLIGKRLREFLPPEQPESVEHLRRFIRSGYCLSNEVSRERDREGGDVFFLNNVVGVVEDGKLVRTWGTQSDITERVRADEALRQSETFLRLSQEAGHCGSYEVDLATRRVQWSDEACRIHGVTRAEFEKMNRHPGAILSLVHADDLASLRQYIQTIYEGGQAAPREYRVVRPDGAERHLYINGEVVPATASQPRRVVGTMTDVTEYRQTAETLRRIFDVVRALTGQDFFHSLADQLARACGVQYALVSLIDPADPNRAHAIAVSHQGEQVEPFSYTLAGTPCASIVEKSFCYYPTGIQQTFPEDAHLVEMGMDAYMGIPLFSRAGKPLGLIALLHDRPIPNPDQVQGILRVLAARAGAEMEREIAEGVLRESDGFNRQIIASTQAGMIVLDTDLRYRLWNPRMEEISGLRAEEVLGKHPQELFPFLEEAGVLPLLGRALTGETITVPDLPFAVSDTGCAGWTMQTLTPLRDASDQIVGVLASVLDVTERHEQQQRLESQFQLLAALRAIDLSIIHSQDLPSTLRLILDHTLALLGADAAAILLADRETGALTCAAHRGFREGSAPPPILSEDDPAQIAAHKRRRVTLADLPDGGAAFRKALPEPFVGGYAAIPLIADGRVLGVLEIYHRDGPPADPDWLETLGGQAAIAAKNAALVADLERANREMVISHDATIEGWSRALDLRDKETVGHSERVTALTVRLAQAMGIEGDQLLHIRRGALLHDVGKLGIPDGILLKSGPLTDDEWELMHKHPIYAHQMLSPISFLRPALDIPLYHHEKWDGTGYPHGLKGEEIPLAARIFALADVYDALRSNRPYRAGWPAERVREHIRSLAGTHLDPSVVAAFLELGDV